MNVGEPLLILHPLLNIRKVMLEKKLYEFREHRKALNWSSHMAHITHIRESSYKFNVCAKTWLEDILFNIRHAKEKLHQCQERRWALSYTLPLIKQQRIHTREKPSTCNGFGKVYVRGYTLFNIRQFLLARNPINAMNMAQLSVTYCSTNQSTSK